jgi:hypothetical protein
VTEALDLRFVVGGQPLYGDETPAQEIPLPVVQMVSEV